MSGRTGPARRTGSRAWPPGGGLRIIVRRVLGRVTRALGAALGHLLGHPLGLALGLVLAFAAAGVQAGNQQYEALSASVRSSLAAAIADDHAVQPLWDSPTHKVDWLTHMSDRLPRRHKPSLPERIDFLEIVRYEAQRAGLDPSLVLGLIQVESGFRRHAISSAGARGYMQVMPFWVDVIGDGDASALFDMRRNIRYGCVILRHYLDIEKGNLFFALGRYNGSRGRDPYPNAVLAAWKRWQLPPARTGTAGEGTR